MNEKPQSSAVKQRLPALFIGSLVSTILFVSCFLLPPAGIFLCLLVPFPAMLLRFSYGRELGTGVVLGAAGLIAVAFDNQAAYFYMALFGIVSMLLPELLARGLGAARSIAWTTAVNLLVAALAAAALAYISGVNVHQLAVSLINNNHAAALSFYEKVGFKGDDLALVKQSLAVTRDIFVRVYPAVITMLLIIIASVNVMLVKRFAGRLTDAPEIGDFKSFKTPEYLVWLLIVSGFSLLPDNPLVNTPALNVLIILCLVYLFQGMAVVLTVIERSAFASMLRIILYVLLVIQPYIIAPVIALGIFDLWGDFRAPRKQENL